MSGSAGGEALRQVAGEEMNTVQNANTHNLTAGLGMQRLYQFLGLNGRKKVSNANRSQNPFDTNTTSRPPADASNFSPQSGYYGQKSDL